MDRLLRGLAVALVIANAAVLAYVLASATRLVPSWFDRPAAAEVPEQAASMHRTRHSPPGEECDHLLIQLKTSCIELYGGRLPDEEAARIEAIRGTEDCSGGSDLVEAIREEYLDAFRQQGREAPEFLKLQ